MPLRDIYFRYVPAPETHKVVLIKRVFEWIEPSVTSVTQPVFKRHGQPGLVGVAATTKCKEGIFWVHRERTEFQSSDQKLFDYHAF